MYAFYSCISLERAFLPNAKTIGANAFYNCRNLTTLIIGLDNSSVCQLYNSTVFIATPSNLSIYVPSSLYSSYIVASFWSLISSRIFSYTG